MPYALACMLLMAATIVNSASSCAGDRLLSLHIYASLPYAEMLASAADSKVLSRYKLRLCVRVLPLGLWPIGRTRRS
jgi:hypothetical protein